MGHHFCEAIIEYCQVDDATFKQMVSEIEDIIQNSLNKNENEKLTVQPFDNEMPSQLEKAGDPSALIGVGLGTIQDEADSNQDSDFSGDDEDKPAKEQININGENSDENGENGAEDEDGGGTGKNAKKGEESG